jgi:hypothetical protein
MIRVPTKHTIHFKDPAELERRQSSCSKRGMHSYKPRGDGALICTCCAGVLVHHGNLATFTPAKWPKEKP